ncbi:MAG TPA: hypothetical protein VFU47_16620, partial [Armatimonadota bacterium]|nr:hypothetical protein [Armatimonadota bacterium]
MRELPDPEQVARFLPAAWLAARGVLPDRATTLRATDPGWDSAIAQFQAALAHFRRVYATELAIFRPEIFGVRELEAWYRAAYEAGKRIFGRRKALQRVADCLAPYVNTGAGIDPDAVARTIGRLLEARAQASALYQQVHAIGGLRLPHGWLPTAPAAEEHLAEACQASVTSRNLLAENAAMWSLLEAGFSQADANLLDRLRAVWRAWRGALDSGPAEFAFWAGEAGWYETWQRDGASWLVELRGEGLLPVQRWGALLTHLDVLAQAGLTEFRDQLLRGVIDPDSAEEAYQRGVAATALTERLRAGDVEYFDA